MQLRLKSMILGLAAVACAGGALADEEDHRSSGIAHLDHVFVIMMENQQYSFIRNNPYMPFFNKFVGRSNLATNYYGVAHPSLTNYLEIVGGSNFGVNDDNNPDWHNPSCVSTLSGPAGYSNESTPANVCPIAGTGVDAPTLAYDCTNESTGDPTTHVGCDVNVDGTVSFPAAPTIAKTIADQLSDAGLSWKAYEESLPPTGADKVNVADGLYSTVNPPASGSLAGLYKAKHDPFVYFANIQQYGLKHIVGFSGDHGLFEDLRKGHVPNYSFIAPNQCHDQHSTGPDVECHNNGAIYEGDVALELIVGEIESSRVWRDGNNAIVVVWDENDYSNFPVSNQVVLTVTSNHDEANGHQSGKLYTHFSLLKTIEAGFDLPCLNHACDPGVAVMTDLFPSR